MKHVIKKTKKHTDTHVQMHKRQCLIISITFVIARPQETAIHGHVAQSSQHDSSWNWTKVPHMGCQEADRRGRCNQ